MDYTRNCFGLSCLISHEPIILMDEITIETRLIISAISSIKSVRFMMLSPRFIFIGRRDSIAFQHDFYPPSFVVAIREFFILFL